MYEKRTASIQFLICGWWSERFGTWKFL